MRPRQTKKKDTVVSSPLEVSRSFCGRSRYNCGSLCEFEAWWNSGIRRGFETLGRDLAERQVLQAVQRRQVRVRACVTVCGCL